MTSPSPIPNIRTRILIISDTHGLVPSPEDAAVLQQLQQHNSNADLTFVSAFRHPLPSADVAIHCGDLTMGSKEKEYEATFFSLLASLDAPLTHP
ncbi:hypothetical protein NKR19_g5996 [Coniochaeta hoffmannii]|uniref:Calcineurin-like phosphoesterase domain-containing protein n=1 Tax=Coniochaeta hoffmannii TaxID=91930 RepID=A0AA38VR24_9PEZI|nr:hypothetical protein NKR19_g5996 [Coniochaeta hoffmannii]